MSVQDWLTIAAIIISVISLIIAIKYSRPQAQLAETQNEEIRVKKTQEHYDNLVKWFFSQVISTLGPGTLNENAIFDGVGDTFENLKEISENDAFEEYWVAGLKHLRIDNNDSYELLKTLKEKMRLLTTDTNNLNDMVSSKIERTVGSQGLSTDKYPISLGKILIINLQESVKRDLAWYLAKCTNNNDDCRKYIINATLPEESQINAIGELVRYNSALAKLSGDLTKEKVDSLVEKIEKDEDIVAKIMEIRNMRIDLRDNMIEIRNSCQLINKKILTKAYKTHAECCPR
jgi:hypothetical protein